MFEHRNKPLLPRKDFLRRFTTFAFLSGCIIVFSLAIGVAGYRALEHLSWTDAFLAAAMIMGGMGPVGEPQTEAGKIFAGFYALYCGLVLLIAVGLLAAPVYHRFIHKFHLESAEDADDREANARS